ncbi:MAG: hypothetical protein ACLP1D_04975, partial [Xanthobacteraceae bacterium]
IASSDHTTTSNSSSTVPSNFRWRIFMWQATRELRKPGTSGPIPIFASHFGRLFANIGIKGPLAKLKWLVELWI